MVFSNFYKNRDIAEADGVNIGGWSLNNVLTPLKKDGKHASREDNIETSGVASNDWTKEEEAALVRKLDRRVLFPCFIIYVLAYLDRSNLGNINVIQKGLPSNIQSRLNLKGSEFNWAISVTYFTVTVLLFPMNLALKKFGAKKWLPCLMVTWGVIVMTMAACSNGPGLISARFMLGVPEAGVVPCCLLYFSFWYKPSERAFRMGIFDSANSLASVISGFLAIGISYMNRVGGLDGWQWVLIIEGALPIVLAGPLAWTLLSFPETSTQLTERERYIAINRLPRGATRKTDVTWDSAAFLRIMSRPSTYMFFTSFICLCTVAVGLANFLPTILSNFMGFSGLKSNLYSAITNMVAFPLFWFFGWHSDWTRERMWHYIIPATISIPGFAVWTYVSMNPAARGSGGISATSLYGMAFLSQMVRIGQPIIMSYRSSTLYGATEQATGGAALVAALSFASIVGPQMYPKTDAPTYRPGFTATCCLLVLCILSYLSLPILLNWEAKRRKDKTGNAMPLQAMADAENSQVSDANMDGVIGMNAQDDAVSERQKEIVLEEGKSDHLEKSDVLEDQKE